MMLFNFIGRMFARDLAIDLGTANTLVFVRGEGIVLDEPSIIAVNAADHSVVAVGHDAKAMVGRTPGNLAVIRPLKDGVIADLDAAQKMIQHFIAKAHGRPRTRLRPRIVIGVPSGITQVRSEEHTSELQSQSNLVCRLLLEKKKKKKKNKHHN